MHNALNIHVSLMAVSLVLALCAAFGVPSKVGLFPLSFAAYLIALYFT